MEGVTAKFFLILGEAGAPPSPQPITAEILALAATLQDAPDRYFVLSPGHKKLPLQALVLSRARPKGIANAVALMSDAYAGKVPKRDPIRVTRLAGDQFLVLDGNSTCIIATAAGWASIPAIEVERDGR